MFHSSGTRVSEELLWRAIQRILCNLKSLCTLKDTSLHHLFKIFHGTIISVEICVCLLCSATPTLQELATSLATMNSSAIWTCRLLARRLCIWGFGNQPELMVVNVLYTNVLRGPRGYREPSSSTQTVKLMEDQVTEASGVPGSILWVIRYYLTVSLGPFVWPLIWKGQIMHSGSRIREISVSSRLAWSTK